MTEPKGRSLQFKVKPSNKMEKINARWKYSGTGRQDGRGAGGSGARGSWGSCQPQALSLMPGVMCLMPGGMRHMPGGMCLMQESCASCMRHVPHARSHVPGVSSCQD